MRFLWRALGVAVVLIHVTAYAQEGGDERQPQVTKAPSLVTFVEAEYPPERKLRSETATVTLSIEIGADGKVSEVHVVGSGGADFDAAAVKAAKQFVFSPGEVDGVPAPVAITYSYHFTIKTQVVKLGPQVNFEGTIRERFSKRIMRGVKVALKLTDGVERASVTDDAGHFEFVDVPLGRVVVQLSAPTLITVKTEETLVKEVKKTVKYFVEEKQEGIDEERVTRAPRVKKESVETTIRTEEARRVPGTQGDTLKVVQNLPGVGRSSFGTGALIVWGSAARETKVNVDGVEIPALYHLGGLRSTVNGDLVRSIELLPGNYGADYGRGLGGLVKVETRSLPDKGIHGYASADVIDASGMVTAALGDRVRVGVAGRYSYLDSVLKGITNEDVSTYVPIPRYYDYQLQLQVKLRRDENLEALLLASHDHLVRGVVSSDPSEVERETTDQTFYRAILRYTRLLPDGASLSVTPSFGWDGSSSTQQFGAVPTDVDSTDYRYGLRAGYRRRVARFVVLSTGLDLSGLKQSTSRFGSINRPAREGDITVFGQPPGDDVNSDQWSNHIVDVAPYAFAEFAAGKYLTVTPGVRVDGYYLEGSRLVPKNGDLPPVGFSRLEFAIDPRLQVTLKPHKRLTLTTAVGLYHQAPDPEDLSSVFGNPKLGLARAIHVSLGAQMRLTGTLSAEVVGFYKVLDGLAMRSALPTPPLAQALTDDGGGRAYGGQLLLRQELWKGLFGWVTYSISRSERKNHPGDAYRLFDNDQTHSLTVVASYEIHGWSVGTRFRYTTGVPRTPVIGAFYDGRGDQYQPVFGAQNSIRIPDFLQLDLRGEKTFTFRRTSLNIYLDVQNVTGRKNPEEIIYNFDFTRRGYITGLPILASFGAKLQW